MGKGVKGSSVWGADDGILYLNMGLFLRGINLTKFE